MNSKAKLKKRPQNFFPEVFFFIHALFFKDKGVEPPLLSEQLLNQLQQGLAKSQFPNSLIISQLLPFKQNPIKNPG